MVERVQIWIVIALIGLLSACAGVEDEVEVDGPNDSFMVDGKADIPNTIHENTPEARAILRVVNTFSLHKMISETNMYWRSAEEIANYRKGPDGMLRTDDDRVIFTLAELDSVPYVGKTALRRLRAYVQKKDLIVFDDMQISQEVPERIDTSVMNVIRSDIKRGERIEIELKGNKGDRLLLMLRKISDARWNPKLSVFDAETRERVVEVNPWGTSDARIPQLNDEAGRGWEIDRETPYTVVLANTNQVDGEFEFSVECVGGPCFAYETDHVTIEELDELQDQELRRAMVALHESNHLRISYYDARMEMFSSLDNVDGVVECVYTGTLVETDTIPSNLVMNAEHTWPQSHGSFDGAARSDLHHIYPVTSQINSIRNNHPFCEVAEITREIGPATLGFDEEGVRCFEPRDEHKGALARSMFYFAAVYQQSIDDRQESVLRKWHREHPVSAAERIRSRHVQVFQGSKQPFVEKPHLVDHIADF